MDKKKLIIGGSILVILIIGGTIFSLNKLKNNKQEPIKVEENKKDNKIVEKSNEENKGLSDEELKKKYYLLQNSNISVKDRVEASEVARKFAKDMTEFDINNPKKNEEEALSLVSTDIDKEVEGYFITLGQSKEIKEKKVTKIRSEERNNKDNNGYVYIYVTVVYDNIDENNQKKQDSKSYKMQLLKIDNEYKITSYKEY
ncbi:hypothetical protein LI034_11625 [Clostridium perfringens]|uniref:Lipoprotein n=5 Tax=Clostridium perfringens TaxID=1502 RepID=A0AAV3FER9_CLOPF|nr:hypothetical protein [Clostridium perfringens]ATD49000.1 hypothetical protein CMR01_09480 [Clostridium perfringens]EHK2426066.1 hypothetical protein [Clostridium perfringens]EIA17781.1 hypothetical protein HA1_05602 [Clostridium perfringens F262]ELC8366851.1 hypothetical protein [Clostridium perfringens]ELC8371522.1 hypothetical protein [Clostridium perfringens]